LSKEEDKLSSNTNYEFKRDKAEQIAQRRQRIQYERKLADRDRLLQELHVHQIELELQNEELRQAQANLEFTHQQYLDLYNEAPVGYASLDDSGLIIQANQMLATMLGMEKHTLTGRALVEFMLPHDQNIFRSRFNAFVRQPKHKHIDVRFNTGQDANDTNTFVGRIQGHRLDKHEKSADIKAWTETILVVISDVTELKKSEERIHYQAYHDVLTGIPNRAMLYDQLENALSLAKRQKNYGAILYMDLDRFKNINDSLGHHTGDQLLIALTKRLREHIRREDLLVRMGGDEFVVLLAEQHQDNNIMAVIAQRFAEQITEALSEPLTVKEQDFQITLSIGISIFPFQIQDNIDDIVRQADTAMYQAKKDGRSTVRFYQTKMQDNAKQRMTIEAELRIALLEKQFTLFYQPQYGADGKIHALEALIRWQHPYRGIVSPNKFINVAEDTGMIVTLGAWVIEQVIAHILEWQKQNTFDTEIRFAINISPKQLESPTFSDQVEHYIDLYNIDPKCLVFEITESLLIPDNNTANKTFKRLSDLGLILSVDDFGTGYSSLSTIHNAPIRQLKIDRSFIKDLHWPKGAIEPNQDRQYTLVNAILSLGKALGFDVVAEGVESKEQLRVLQHLGCRYLQGFYFSKPCPASEISSILTELSIDNTKSD
jgi:diguanylate cyclase (GGDEF)-like protein/PAS domain S-box-containing protein